MRLVMILVGVARGMNRGAARRSAIGLVALSLFVGEAAAQPPFALKFKPGMILPYKSRHQTSVETAAAGASMRSSSTVEQIKEWKVVDVDSLGVATIEMTIRALRLDQLDSDGESIRYDSSDPSKAPPDLAKQFAEFVGKPVVRVQVSPSGQVKESKALTSQKNILRELPFYVVMTDDLPRVGLAWNREFAVTLEPPLGSGQAFKAVQACQLAEVTESTLKVAFESKTVEDPTTAEARISLIQQLPKGEVVFDWKRGVMLSARMVIDEKVENFAGADSVYKLKSQYVEQLVEDLAQSRGGEKR